MIGAIIVAAGTLSCSFGPAQKDELFAYTHNRGLLTSISSTMEPSRGRYQVHRIMLTSNTGVVARGIVMQPMPDTGHLPAVLLQDGREENSGAIDRLPKEFGDVVVLSLDYPPSVPMRISLSDALFHSDSLRTAAQRIPQMFSLGAVYLAQRDDVDTTRIAIAATSFAVPFATIAAAADTRFRNVALIYGAGDLSAVLAANLDTHPAWLRSPLAWLATRPFRSLSPERFIGAISPRPIVMVNGIDDPQMPAEAARDLYNAAREPKTQIWLKTGHLMPTDSALIRSLVDTALARMPVLGRSR
ncbi:MAG TPA: alpha/beta hydrolase [Gemmatimonadaceae bacterium]|nr:alpha/beta hydrolase [Gemmatimonadaceae bacterium]